MNQTEQMAQEKIPKLLLRFSLPAIVGLLVNSLYNIIDSMFVGRGVGDLGLAGVTVGLQPILPSLCLLVWGLLHLFLFA